MFIRCCTELLRSLLLIQWVEDSVGTYCCCYTFLSCHCRCLKLGLCQKLRWIKINRVCRKVIKQQISMFYFRVMSCLGSLFAVCFHGCWGFDYISQWILSIWFHFTVICGYNLFNVVIGPPHSILFCHGIGSGSGYERKKCGPPSWVRILDLCRLLRLGSGRPRDGRVGAWRSRHLGEKGYGEGIGFPLGMIDMEPKILSPVTGTPHRAIVFL